MDELPQLWSIFRGDMSFVGPRPEWVELVKKFRAEIPGFDLRHQVVPGLTGLAQVYGHSEMSRRNKLRYDLLYARRRSFWLDIRLVLISFVVTFTGRWERREGKISRRRQQRYGMTGVS
jgi:lipopolysaccharide/colanic/teichoic acid biosynthesis glycosyltransferase